MAGRVESPAPRRLPLDLPGLGPALDQVEADLREAFPQLPQPRWVALRLLEGDPEIIEAVRSGGIGSLPEPVAIAPQG